MAYYRLCRSTSATSCGSSRIDSVPGDNSAPVMATEMKRPMKFEVWAIDRFVGETGSSARA